MNSRRLIRLTSLLALLLLAVAGAAFAQEKDGNDAQKRKTTEKRVSEVKVWTNEELAKLASGGSDPEPTTLPPVPAGQAGSPPPTPAPTPAQPATPAPDPLAAMQEAAQRRVERQAEIRTAQQTLIAAEARVAALEKQALAVRNPFLARPKVDESQRAAWSGMSPSERAEQTAKELADAKAAVDQARSALDAARRGG